MLPLARNGFTAAQVTDALHGRSGSREVKFRYDLLASSDQYKKTLTAVESGEVAMASLADIKRTARFSLRDDPEIDWLSDRIQPWCLIRVGSGWAEFPLGIFLLNTPKKTVRRRQLYRDIEAYDGIQVLADDKFVARYTLAAGEGYYGAIIGILSAAGITKTNIEYTALTLPIAKEWPPGAPRITAVNELLREINYTQLWHDEYGYYIATAYRSPSVRAPDYTYAEGELSVLSPEPEEELDLFNIPNKWVVVASNPEAAALTSTYTNSNPDSPTSTVSRGRIIVDYREVDNIADQASLDAYTQRIAFEASQVYNLISFETAIMPMHSYADVLQLVYSPLGLNGKFVETNWTIPLKAGAMMKHQARKITQI
jgi:hypothetical protein